MLQHIMGDFPLEPLVDEKEVTEYTVHASPIRNAIFDSGATISFANNPSL